MYARWFAFTCLSFGIIQTVPAEAGNAYGTTASAAGAPSRVNDAVAGVIKPAQIYVDAQYATAGVALRNRGSGALNITGIVKPVRAAFLYWALIENDGPRPGENTVTLQRLPGGSARMKLTGSVIGQGPSPCWGGMAIVIYKALVPPILAVDNGTYQVILDPRATGLTDGSDPDVSPVRFPLWEGASLVVLGNGSKGVSIFDAGLSGQTFKGSLRYVLQLPTPALSTVLFDSIGADGQIGSSRGAVRGLPAKTTSINGVPIAGPKSIVGDSDWDGSVGLPAPRLWDDSGHDVTAAAQNTRLLKVAITSEAGPVKDCATPVANVVQY